MSKVHFQHGQTKQYLLSRYSISRADYNFGFPRGPGALPTEMEGFDCIKRFRQMENFFYQKHSSSREGDNKGNNRSPVWTLGSFHIGDCNVALFLLTDKYQVNWERSGIDMQFLPTVCRENHASQ